jgi:type IV secretion system protein VirB10
MTEEKQKPDGPRVAKSDKETKHYGKRVIFLFIFGIGALLCLITAQARFGRGNPPREGEKDYRAPRQEGFAELAAGMRKERRRAVEKPEPAERKIPDEPVREPEKIPEKTPEKGARLILRAERPASPHRYYSNDEDTRAASTLRTLKLQALAAKPVVEDFSLKESGDESASSRAGSSSGTGNAGADGAVVDAAAMAAIAQQSGARDANMQERKMDFLRSGGGALTPQGYSENLPIPRQFPYELKAGTIIPGIMVTGINSDLPGNVIGQVSENVWDTATGKYVLIPKGTRILGVYDSRVTFGQRRVLLVWNRLVFPNGTTLDIAGSPGMDQAGYSGLSGRVNEHWGTMLKSALLASVFVAGAELVYDSDSQGNNQNKSPQDVAAESTARGIIDMGAKLVDRAAGIQPTITIRPGKRMAIFVQRDVVFPYPYEMRHAFPP